VDVAKLEQKDGGRYATEKKVVEEIRVFCYYNSVFRDGNLNNLDIAQQMPCGVESCVDGIESEAGK
jgi:hypothetical protein